MAIFDPNIFDSNIFDTPVVAVQVGASPQQLAELIKVKRKRIPIHVSAVACAPITATTHLLTVQLFCILLEKLVYEGGLTSSLQRQVPQVIKLCGCNKAGLTLDALVVSNLEMKLMETVRAHGQIDRSKLFIVLKTLKS